MKRPFPIVLLVMAVFVSACSPQGPAKERPPVTLPAAVANPVAGADGPGRGTPTVVSVGDSYISGEGGRWAGNVDVIGRLDSTAIDALGPGAYYDNAGDSAETIANCHRSKAAEVHIGSAQDGSPVASINLACSGVTTLTDASKADFKPGLDAYGDADGQLTTDEPTAPGARISQAVALRQVALTHNVKVVVVSIGGNNFHFADTIEACVKNFLLSSSLSKNYCNGDPAVAANFDAASAALRQAEIALAFHNLHDAMIGAGYRDDMWTLVVQTPPSPLPRGSSIRYTQVGYSRQVTGGCGFYDADADWANDKILPVVSSTIKAAAASLPFTNVRLLDLGAAFNGRRLCENTVGTLNDRGLKSWRDPGAVDQTEWIVPVRGVINSDNLGAGSPYQKLESFHPNYWGELALRACLRLAYNNGTVQGGTCTIGATGLNDRGEPVMQLQPN